MDLLHADVPAWVAAGVLALSGIAIGLRKLYLDWTRDDVRLAENQARKSIVEQLHEELTRMSTQNIALAGELNKLQLHILELTKQIGALSVKNAELEEEISQLRMEINRLRAVTTVTGGLE